MKLFEGFGYFEKKKKNPPNVNEFHLLSYLIPPPPLIRPYRYTGGIIEVEILGRQ